MAHRPWGACGEQAHRHGKKLAVTITPTAPSVTPCPVPWCPDAGHHEWTADHLGLPTRMHSREVLCVPTGYGRYLTVAADYYETADKSCEPTVDTCNADVLHSREQVEQVIAAIHEAADLAFGPVSTVVDANDFDAALKEVVDRAANPTDVIRLVAAAIRFRQAYLAVDAELDAEEKAEATR